MTDFKAVDYGPDYSVDRLFTNTNTRLYTPVSVNWTEAVTWPKNEAVPVSFIPNHAGYLYLFTWHAGRSSQQDVIRYIGLTTNPSARFKNHHVATRLQSQGSTLQISVGYLAFPPYARMTADNCLEELEHIYIWSIPSADLNERKQQTVPGQGLNGSRAWHIKNSGCHFQGQMPAEIIYPWIVTKSVDMRGRHIR